MEFLVNEREGEKVTCYTVIITPKWPNLHFTKRDLVPPKEIVSYEYLHMKEESPGFNSKGDIGLQFSDFKSRSIEDWKSRKCDH